MRFSFACNLYGVGFAWPLNVVQCRIFGSGLTEEWVSFGIHPLDWSPKQYFFANKVSYLLYAVVIKVFAY